MDVAKNGKEENYKAEVSQGVKPRSLMIGY